jgi:signal peptidase I
MKMKQKNETEPRPEKTHRKIFQEYSEAFVVAVILAILIRALFFQAFKIPSSSMEPTLLIGDHILVNKFWYGVRIPFTNARWPDFVQPGRGDVIVFIYPEDRTKDFIKRVIAVGGDTIEIRNKKVILNGKEVPDPHAHYFSNVIYPAEVLPRDNMKPVTVPADHLFVMGDNRDFSHDSRFWGFVPVEEVKGKAVIIYYSGMDFQQVRWNRFMKLIN